MVEGKGKKKEGEKKRRTEKREGRGGGGDARGWIPNRKVAAACRQGIWREKRIRTRRRGNTASNTSRSSGGGGNKSEKEGKKYRGRGSGKGIKLRVEPFERGGKRFSYPFASFFFPLLSPPRHPVPLFLHLEAPSSSSSPPTRSSRSFFSKHFTSWWGKQEQLHPRSHEHPFYFSSTTIHDSIGGEEGHGKESGG